MIVLQTQDLRTFPDLRYRASNNLAGVDSRTLELTGVGTFPGFAQDRM